MSAVVHAVTADDINSEHRLARQSAENAVQHAIRCGELLLQKKSELKHGEFRAWVEANCEFEQYTATRYITAANQNATGVAISSLRGLFPSGCPKLSGLSPELLLGLNRTLASDLTRGDVQDNDYEPDTADSMAEARGCAVNREALLSRYELVIEVIEMTLTVPNCCGGFCERNKKDEAEIEPEAQIAALRLTLEIFKRLRDAQIETNRGYERQFERLKQLKQAKSGKPGVSAA